MKTISYLNENISITNAKYQTHCNTSERTALRDLKELVELGLLIKEGIKKNTKYRIKMSEKIAQHAHYSLNKEKIEKLMTGLSNLFKTK